MKKLSTLLLASLILATFSVGCKDKKTEEEPAQQEQAVQEEAQGDTEQEEAAEDAAEEEAAEEEEVAEEEEALVDEAMFIKAAYEVSCVKAKIDNPEEQKEILEIVYPRYGFETVEEYAAAETSLKDSASVKAALDAKMADCTEEAAKGFKTAGAGEEQPAEEAKGDEKAPAKKKPRPIQGTFQGSHSGNGIESGRVSCTANQGTFKCLVTGKAEGKGFSIPVSGKVDASGKFSASGARGKNKASVNGTISGKKASGSLSLTVFERQYTTNWN